MIISLTISLVNSFLMLSVTSSTICALSCSTNSELTIGSCDFLSARFVSLIDVAILVLSVIGVIVSCVDVVVSIN